MTRWRWSVASVKLRLLLGLALLLVVGLVASSVAGAYLLDDFVQKRYVSTLQDSAERVADVIDDGPQEANSDQLSALIGSPLGIVAVDDQGAVLLSTGAAEDAAGALAAATRSAPPGRVLTYDRTPDIDDLSAVRIPSPGLVITWPDGRPDVRPAALILAIDTSVDDATIGSLVRRQAAIVAVSLVILLGLAVVVLRVGMRPLARMARSADSIAAGSLSERLPTRGDRSETDQLAVAVNRAFDAQTRAEETVRSFVADTSHELRTPLSTISGWLDLRRQGGLSDAELNDALEHIDNEVGRMRLLVEELGLLARLDAGRPVEQDPLDLTALADSVVEDALVVYGDRQITLRSDGPAHVTGDAPRLQQVLRNLVGNAVQHTPPGTSVLVTIATGEDEVRVAVIDDGPGIAPEDLPRVFERFWRAEASRSRAYGGSGLGLAIVQAIVTAHAGHVGVESAVGVGTTVTVSLPRSAQRGPSTAPDGPTTTAGPVP